MPKINGVLVTHRQAQVHSTLKKFGPLPDQALVPLMQHVAVQHQSSSGIRTRRSELEALGLVEDTGDKITTLSGRRAAVYKAV